MTGRMMREGPTGRRVSELVIKTTDAWVLEAVQGCVSTLDGLLSMQGEEKHNARLPASGQRPARHC